MDVPFTSTPALSRPLYSLVYAIENADSGDTERVQNAINDWLTRSGLGNVAHESSTSSSFSQSSSSATSLLSGSIIAAFNNRLSSLAGAATSLGSRSKAKEALVGVLYLHEASLLRFVPGRYIEESFVLALSLAGGLTGHLEDKRLGVRLFLVYLV